MTLTKIETVSIGSTVFLTIISLLLLLKTIDTQKEAEKYKAESLNNRKAIETLAIEYVKLDAQCRYEKVWRGKVAEKARSNGVMLPMPPLVRTGV